MAGVLWATTNAAGAATWRGAYVTRLRCSALAVPNVRHAEHLLLNGSVAERSLTVDPLKPRLRDARNRAVPVDFEWTQFPLGTKRSPGRVRVQTPKSCFVCRNALNHKQKGEKWHNLAAVVIARRPIILRCRIEVKS